MREAGLSRTADLKTERRKVPGPFGLALAIAGKMEQTTPGRLIEKRIKREHA
jgi:hypothetical protein